MPSMVPLLFKPPSRPVVCFGESPIQLIGETRRPIPARPGQLGRYDCEYKRNGTANLFIVLDTHRSWRRVKVTDSRAAVDFAACVRELCDVRFPEAERIRVVLENLSTHSAGGALPAFLAGEARPHAAPAGVPLHAQARQLAQQGGDRNRRSVQPMPRPADRRKGPPHRRGRRMGTTAQRFGRDDPMDVHNRRAKMGRAIPTPTSHNYRAAVLIGATHRLTDDEPSARGPS